MKNIIKTTAYSAVAMASVATTFAAQGTNGDLYGRQEIDTYKQGNGNGDIMTTLNSILTYILGFLSFIAIAFAIYGGFQILTAGGDDEKVKKGKTTLINALIGIFVIMISYTLVNWILVAAPNNI